MATFVLVHGMYHGGWCWDRVQLRLEADGHRVIAPDLAGCGTDDTPAAEVSLDGWADSIASLIRSAGEPVVLVGHSRGGMVISQAAERASEDIAVLVYLTALLLPPGTSPMDMPRILGDAGMEAGDTPPVEARFSEDGLCMLPPLNAETLFYGDCSAEDTAWAMPQVGPEPIAPLMTPVSISAERWGSIPKVYIEATRDITVPPGMQRAMCKVSPVDEVIPIDSDHMPIFTHVEELSTILEDVAERYAKAPVAG